MLTYRTYFIVSGGSVENKSKSTHAIVVRVIAKRRQENETT